MTAQVERPRGGPGMIRAAIDDIMAVLELRLAVEVEAAALAAVRHTDEDLSAMSAVLDGVTANGGNWAVAVGADLAFHRALLAATGNELLTKMEVIMETGLADRDRLVHKVKPSGDPVPSHRRVVDAVRAHDPEAAELAMRELLAKAASDLTEVRGSSRKGRR